MGGAQSARGETEVHGLGHCSRQQIWDDGTDGGLEQTGNWRRWKLDLNGDNDFVDTDEFDDDRTHNAANEMTARDTDNNGSNNYTQTTDAAGNLTDDGKSYKFIYDGFNRLVKVTDRAMTPRTRAEYRYNGLGWRIGVHDDADVDNDVDSNDPLITGSFHVHDLKWRIVNTYRVASSGGGTLDAAANAKERWIYQNAGLSGSGGSSYIDLVILRDRDHNTSWSSAGDGTLERRANLRIGYCQNWHADVAAVVTDTGKQVEFGHYPGAYGTPFGIAGTDADTSGVINGTDVTLINGWIGSSYRARGDWNLDGTVDAADSAECSSRSGTTLGWKKLSAVSNTRSVAGYLEDRVLPIIHQRHRVLHEELGRWVQRDPEGYVDGMNQSAYGLSNSLKQLDPTGLCGGMTPMPMEGCEHTDHWHLFPLDEDSVWTPSNACVACGLAAAANVKIEMMLNDIEYADDKNGGNAFQHCVFACQVAKLCGEDCARWFVDGRETHPELGSDKQDLANNKVGYECASSPSCWDCCTTAWKNGTLTCHTPTRSEPHKRGPCPPPAKRAAPSNSPIEIWQQHPQSKVAKEVVFLLID